MNKYNTFTTITNSIFTLNERLPEVKFGMSRNVIDLLYIQ